jgi:integrase
MSCPGLLKDASEGRTPESAATVATLLEEYAVVAPWDVSTRQTNEGFIRRTIKPALGHIEVRKDPEGDDENSRIMR